MINYFQIPMIMFRYSILYCDQQKRAWIWNKYCSPLVNDEAPWFLHDNAYVEVILITSKWGMTIAYRIWYVIESNEIWIHWFYMRKEDARRRHLRYKGSSLENVFAVTEYWYQAKWSCVLDFMSFPNWDYR